MPRQTDSIIDAYLKYTEGHESTLRVRKWCVIPIIAAALERRVWINRGFYTLFPNLYTFIIGRSGFVKKSTSTAIAVNLLRELPDIRIMSERLTAGSLVQQLSLAGKKFELNGQEVAQSPLFSYASELAVFLDEVFGSITELLTTFYDCQPNDSSKPWIYNSMGRGAMKIYGPCLNILGASTKAWLRKCIPRSEMEGGFTSRIIFVVEENLPDKLVAWPEADPALEALRAQIINDLKEVHLLKGQFAISPNAKKLFEKWYTHHMREVLPLNQDPRMIGYMSRKGDTILKLAMTHSVQKSNALTIEKEDLIWANKEIDDLEEDWRLAFDGVGVVKNLTKELLDHIRGKAIVKKADVAIQFGKRFQLSEVAKSLTDLVNMGEIEENEITENGKKHPVFCTPGALSISWGNPKDNPNKTIF